MGRKVDYSKFETRTVVHEGTQVGQIVVAYERKPGDPHGPKTLVRYIRIQHVSRLTDRNTGSVDYMGFGKYVTEQVFRNSLSPAIALTEDQVHS